MPDTQTNQDIRTIGQNGASAEETPLCISETDALREENNKLKQEHAELLLMAQRVQADFDNYRKRNANIRADSFQEGILEALTAILPVVDNMERAIAQTDKQEGEDSAFVQGVQMVQQQLDSVLAKYEVQAISASGAIFDPSFHNAVMQEDCPGKEPGTVLQVMQTGYQCGGKVLRYAMVKVSS